MVSRNSLTIKKQSVFQGFFTTCLPVLSLMVLGLDENGEPGFAFPVFFSWVFFRLSSMLRKLVSLIQNCFEICNAIPFFYFYIFSLIMASFSWLSMFNGKHSILIMDHAMAAKLQFFIMCQRILMYFFSNDYKAFYI